MASDGTASDPRRRAAAVQSVDRAVSIMEILARDGWSGVTEIARELDVHKSTVFRLVSTLEARGIVEQDPSSNKYRLGFAMARLAAGIRGEIDLVEVARPACEQLSERLDEPVNLAVLEEGEVISIVQADLSTSLISVDWIGQRHPLHATASGKVFLTWGPADLRQDVLGRPLQARTKRTITDPDELRRDLERARSRGYAVTIGELERGLHAVAAPVRDPDGVVVAAIVASGPEYRLEPRQLADAGALVRETADTVSRRLGWLGPTGDLATQGR
ncbi:IclR family transcriptional regulator [Egicoccus sp. AB-alg2]|uniref:IclR family transcriptional regulator n=1 Tax=Egicoccus sp. AB-alg2 TaxID=3242693 RepID=UPI00359CC47D